ncbi:MAG: RDD family protein [Bacteroidota bacterium]
MLSPNRPVFLRRIGAYLLDIVVLFSVLAPLGGGVQWILGVEPGSTPQSIYLALMLNFSVPVWAYFTILDASARGATLGKRVFRLRTTTRGGAPVGLARAFGRTAVKMVPWELTHVSAFLLPPAMGEFPPASWGGIGVAYVLSFSYLAVAWRSQGRRSVHDLTVGTHVV